MHFTLLSGAFMRSVFRTRRPLGAISDLWLARTLGVVLLTHAFLLATAANAQVKADLYIFGGQSNAIGAQMPRNVFVQDYCVTGSFSGFLTPVAEGSESRHACENDAVLFSYEMGAKDDTQPGGVTDLVASAQGEFEPLGPTSRASSNSLRFGPELAFARLAKATRPFGGGHQLVIVKTAFGATSLDDWVTPGSYRLLDRLVARIDDAIATLEVAGYEVHVRGMVWVQGEADIMARTDPAAPDRYAARLRSLVSTVRATVRERGVAATFRFVVLRTAMVSGVEENSCKVRCAQQLVVSKDSFGSLASADGLIKKDSFHFPRQSYVTLGQALFSAQVARTRSLPDEYCACDLVPRYTGVPVPIVGCVAQP